jgi:hypothetical protein
MRNQERLVTVPTAVDYKKHYNSWWRGRRFGYTVFRVGVAPIALGNSLLQDDPLATLSGK